ncbi:response regulator transcription factor [Kineosporia sp. A_224]|uniref:response regulator n=1 Tax=Kineosporia sp. A_224 TaxID=1962180 RepID=UPI000B4B7F3B|nr:response regulator transcription factor [Kineosporia sp. A_224]
METEGTIKVLVVDDHEVVRRGVVDVVDADPTLTVVAEAGTVLDAVRRAAAVRPDVAVVDLKLPDGTGIDLVRKLKEDHPGIRCVVLTSFNDDDAVAAALDAGASAFVLKTVRGTEIADTVRAVAAGRNLLDERALARRRAQHTDPTDALTPTEKKVLELIGDGLSNREIGDSLGLAEKTVKNHVTGLLAKMGFRRRTQAAAWVAAHRQGTGWNTSEG